MTYESILESLLYYSPKFRDILVKINHPIAKEILNSEGRTISQDITFIDINEEGVVSFSAMAKAIKKISDFFEGDDLEMDNMFKKSENDDIFSYDMQGKGPGIYTTSRNDIKIGKLVNKILGSRYKDSDMEQFVNLVKAALENKQDFLVIKGTEINDAYNIDNYLSRYGSLGMSCMNNKEFIPLYTKNPEVCQLVILKEMGKIIGRALLWKLDTVTSGNKKLNIRYHMDRIYTTDDYLIYKFQKYAEKNGWSYKTENNFSNKNRITFNNNIYKVRMTIKVNPGEYRAYPYMDTFTRLDIIGGTLYNDSNDNEQGHILNSTGGGSSSQYYPKFPLIKKFKDFFKRRED
jgi:hypothetical protein